MSLVLIKGNRSLHYKMFVLTIIRYNQVWYKQSLLYIVKYYLGLLVMFFFAKWHGYNEVILNDHPLHIY